MVGGVVLGAGGVIVEAVVGQLASVPELAAVTEFHLSGRDRLPLRELLQRCTVLIEEVGTADGRLMLTNVERALLPSTCTTITVPSCRLVSLWPMMTPDPRPLPDGSLIPFSMTDRLAMLVVQNEPDPALRRQRYFEAGLAGVVDLPGLYEMEVRDCFAREQNCDIRIAAYIMSHLADTRLFHTYERPTARLVYFVLSQLCSLAPIRALTSLSYAELLTAARNWSEMTAICTEEQAPIDPRVAAHFGLRWCPLDLRYATVAGWRSYDEWMDFYLSDLKGVAQSVVDTVPAPELNLSRFDRLSAATESAVSWPETFSGGDFAFTLAQQQPSIVIAEITAATRVERVRRFADIDRSGIASQHGHFFSDPTNQRYELHAALVIALRGGTVLGTQGVVLDGDCVLGDTFRSLNAGPTPVMIAEATSGRITLKPGQPARTSILAGMSFCGFGPIWHDLGHWLIGTLPRLVAYAQLRRRFPELRLVLPALPANSVYTETLALLSITPDDITIVGADEAIVCEELMVTTAFDLWSVSPFCHHAAQFLMRNLPPPRSDATTFSRIFLRPRTTSGQLSNFDAIAPLLDRHGFACVFIEDLSLRQRVAILRQARMVVAECGPCLAHILFVPAGAMVLELVAPGGLQPMFWSLASVIGLDYATLVGDRNADDSFDVAPAELAGMLEKMIQNQENRPT